MYEQTKDALEVQGEVLVVELKPVEEIIKEAKDIISKYESQGRLVLSDIPEGHDKQRLRDLLKALGLKVNF